MREYAVSRLEILGDDQLAELLLQLVQVLKYEPYHNSALARFLLLRALRSKYQVAHYFFWYLKAEMHEPEIAQRYGILMEIFLRNCGSAMRIELEKQDEFLKMATKIANNAVTRSKTITQDENVKAVQEDFKKTKFSGPMRLPMSPRWVVNGIIAERCRCMKSKKKPLLITFENNEPNAPPLLILFKVGDDIRQDALTLQMIRLMDKLWSSENLDLRMQPYSVISTGNLEGMLEVVLNSTTVGDIYEQNGGLKAVWDDNVLNKWLKEQTSDVEFNTAQENFALSCAGYCVATYCLGIGDRHNDNIMVSRDGCFFHIDFGHFLGNFKKKFNIQREIPSFVFTPQMATVLDGEGSEKYKHFESTGGRAFNIIRKNNDLFINLFCLMLSTGIPELKSTEDIKYVRDHMFLDLNDAEAEQHFKEQIGNSLSSKRSKILNDASHMVKNKKLFGK